MHAYSLFHGMAQLGIMEVVPSLSLPSRHASRCVNIAAVCLNMHEYIYILLYVHIYIYANRQIPVVI